LVIPFLKVYFLKVYNIRMMESEDNNNVLERLIKVSKDSWTSEGVRTQTKIISCILAGLLIGIGGTCIYFIFYG